MKISAAWVVLTLLVAIECLPMNGGIANGATFANKKAILDGDIDLWTKKEELDRRLERIKHAGFNVYMPAVWYGRGTTWPSRHAPWDFTLRSRTTESYDPLRYAITKAHELGLEVHPWFTLVLRWDHSFMPQYGLEGFAEGPHAAFNVHNPSFREFMTNVVSEVAAGYDIDGINLDYGRAMGLCTDAACQEEYGKTYHRNLMTDSFIFKANPKLVPTLIEYQEKAVTALIKSISDSVRKNKPAVFISADGHPELTRYEQGQNSIAWVNDGLVDLVFGMDYRPVIDGDAVNRVRSKLTNPNALAPLISNMAHGADLPPSRKPYSRSGKWLSDTIASISTRWPNAGIAVYFYKYLSNEQVESLQAGPFKRSISPPSGLLIN
jgi:uncharacterized lipoprotein YddW (UPF0748 family)